MKIHFPPKILIPFWILFIVFCLTLFLIFPECFTPKAIAAFVGQSSNLLLPCYLFISILRGLTLIPNTPFVLAGTILFPQQPFLVLAISILGIIFSSTMIFYFSDYLGFSCYLEKKYPHKMLKIKNKLKESNGFFFFCLWSFLPILPTDAVSYVAGVLKMNFFKFIFALTIGELIICSIYIFGYSSVLKIFN